MHSRHKTLIPKTQDTSSRVDISIICRKLTILYCRIHPKLKCHGISFFQYMHFSCEIVLKICTKHGSDTAMLCANFQNDLATEHKLWANEISWDLSLRCISNGYPTLQQTPGCHDYNQHAKIKINNNTVLPLKPFTAPEAESIGPHCDRSWTFLTLRWSTLVCCHKTIIPLSATYISWV